MAVPESDTERAGRVERPALSVGWWHRGATYAVTYTVSVFLAMEAGIAALTRRPPLTLADLAAPCNCILGTGLTAFFACGLSEGWYLRVFLRRTPYWYILAVATACGSLAGGGIFGFTLIPHPLVRQAGGILLVLGGPLLGVLWLVHRPLRPGDPDYDDEMTPDERPPDVAINLTDLAATDAFGRRLGQLLFPNAVVALIGPLGAGKTHLTRAIAEGLGIANPVAVTSPTFTLIHEYPARLPIFHFDAYRLNGPNEFLDLGAAEYYEAGGVCLIEWADKVEAALPEEHLTIRLVPVNANVRRAEVAAVGESYRAVVELLGRIE